MLTTNPTLQNLSYVYLMIIRFIIGSIQDIIALSEITSLKTKPVRAFINFFIYITKIRSGFILWIYRQLRQHNHIKNLEDRLNYIYDLKMNEIIKKINTPGRGVK